MSVPNPDSPYYPPRAGRGVMFWRLWQGYRRQAPTFARLIPNGALPSVDTPWMAIAVLLTPFLGLHLASPPLIRKVGKIGAVLCAALAIVYFDLLAGRVAIGLLAAIHALGASDYLQAAFPDGTRFRRAVWRAVLTAGYTMLVVEWAPRLMEHVVIRVVTPEGRVILINPRDNAPPRLSGEPVAFYSSGFGIDHMRIYSGRYMGNMIGRGGDRVDFAPDQVIVNGVAHPADPLLPDKGELMIPPGHVFVWPRGIYMRNVSEETSLRIANGFVLPYSALVGRPYTRWFWRTPTPPSP